MYCYAFEQRLFSKLNVKLWFKIAQDDIIITEINKIESYINWKNGFQKSLCR